MRFHQGTVQGAVTAGGGLPPLDPANFESDWTASLVAPPSGWVEITDDGQTYGYTSTGAYGVDASSVLSDVWQHTVGRDITAITLIIGYTIVSFDNVTTNLQIENGFDGVRGDLAYESTDDSGFLAMSLDQLSGWPGSDTPLVAADPNGLVIIAGTVFQSGLRKFYRFDDNGAVIIGSNAGIQPVVQTLGNASVVMQNYDFGNDLPGVGGSYRVNHTYIGYDEELDLAAITAIATGWGWT